MAGDATDNQIGPVLLTGAASGIGAAVLSRLLGAGAPVITVDLAATIEPRPPESAAPASDGEATADAVAPGQLLRHVSCDLSDPTSTETIAEAVRDELRSSGFTSLQAVVNVAGVPGTLDPAVVMEVNLLSMRRLNTALIPAMHAGASIVNVASISGNGWAGRLDLHQQHLALEDEAARAWWSDRAPSVGTDPYSFSKEAVIVHSMQLAYSLLGSGIRCNAVSPGPVQTPLLPQFREQIGDDRLDWVMGHAGRAAEPEEIAQAIEWLAIGDSRWINAHHLVVDGGYTGGLLSGSIDATDAPEPKARPVGQ